MSAPVGLWSEARAPDGRVYYYNTQTKATSWSKPAELSGGGETPVSSSTTAAAWKEYASNGRKYWHNAETNTTTWEMPDALKNTQVQVQIQPQSQFQTQPSKPLAAPAFVAGGLTQYQDSYQSRERDDHGYSHNNNNNRQYNDRSSGYSNSGMQSNTDHDYTTPEEAESAFHKLLRRCGVQADWTWEQTVKATIKEPQYRSIKDPKDRKIAFEKYVAAVRSQEKDKEKDRQAKLRSDFFSMLRSHPEIRHYTRWNTAKSIIEGETIFRAAKTEGEAHAIFNDYRLDLYKSYNEQDSLNRKSALDHLVDLLQSLDLEPYTRWNEAQKTLKADSRFQGDHIFKSLTKIDMLKAFENHIKSLERTFNDSRQKQKSSKAREERQNRDAFISLLNDLRAGGKIKAGTKWSDVHALIDDDPRYVAILGQPGSTPLDLFWDAVEEEERVLRSKRNDALDVLEDQRYELTQKTSYEEFVSVMQTDGRTATIEADSMRQIYERLREKVLRRSDEDRHIQRRAVDALRSKLKHLEPPISSSDTWEQVRPRLEKLEEYRALESDDLRRQAFDKHVKRQREKEEERDRERSKRRERDHGRDHRRDRRSSRDGHHRRHRSRSPAETDPYEADRKRAQADRERQHRRGSFGLSSDRPASRGAATAVAGPPSTGTATDHYDCRQRRRSNTYDRERRDREVEREKTYLSRADPRDAAGALDYGDSKPTAVRRRRGDSEAADAREPKRVRSTTGDAATPTTAKTTMTEKDKADEMEDVAYKSGSEEGEIEEE